MFSLTHVSRAYGPKKLFEDVNRVLDVVIRGHPSPWQTLKEKGVP